METRLGKVAQATLGFWIIKIAATTLGETAGDAVTMSLNLGYLIGPAIFAALFIAAVSAQVRAAVLVRERRDDDGGHDARRLRRALARQWLPRRLGAAAGGAARHARAVEAHVRLGVARIDRLAARRDLLLGDDRVLADAGHRARRLVRGRPRPRLRLQRARVRRRARDHRRALSMDADVAHAAVLGGVHPDPPARRHARRLPRQATRPRRPRAQPLHRLGRARAVHRARGGAAASAGGACRTDRRIVSTSTLATNATAPTAKIVSPTTRSQRSVFIAPECRNSALRAYL